MLLYVDTSALVPLIVDEPSSPLCRDVWRRAETRCSSVLLRVETAAALAQARRMGRLTAEQLSNGLRAAEALLRSMYLVSVTPGVATAAADIAVAHDLRGYDAVHAATAVSVASPDTAVVSGDRALLAASVRLELTVIAVA
ncbi:type II toxin-antitoxin system VapC family toxin [Georgenia sp. EYE_87]|uniref:type II toxin-antitoxin system VapC family toxin n=1 Tax=Georgenia sp. EYE_87 TaxID=2853448 RepID=UPI002004C887|nr:type II toxin-antitoxin system VapC family toxin [Georgenia sp. EYE_87]MCK6211575.1 type II toxin-antitoxin system VapC family toxin [Georgenia sp. EYE_87]